MWSSFAVCCLFGAQLVDGSFAILPLKLAATTTGSSRCDGLGTSRSNQEEVRGTTDIVPGGTSSRRGVLSAMATFAFIATPGNAFAKEDPLFKPNPLTNPVLEKIRIWNQAEADNIKYGGELAPGSTQGRETYGQLLVPILQIRSDFDIINDLVHQENGGGLERARDLLERPELQSKAFKKTFNAHSDNIYFSDPERANLYLAGGATPKSEQSLAYLLRNDILTNLEALQAEVVYLIKERTNGAETVETEDLYKYTANARESMAKYLNLIPPAELKVGRELFSAQSS